MKFSLVICFKRSRVLLWVSQWKLHAEELYFPVPGSCWQSQCEMLLGMPASLGGFFHRSTACFWCGISTGSASPSKSPWFDALRHHILLVPGYWHWVCGCSLLFGSEFLNWAATAVLILCQKLCQSHGELVCKGMLNPWFKGGLKQAGDHHQHPWSDFVTAAWMQLLFFVCSTFLRKWNWLILLISLGVSWP